MSDALPSEYVVCQKARCGRPFVLGVHEDELLDWFIAPRLSGGWVLRCPRHVTRWALRQAGEPWTNANRAKVAESYKRDLERYPVAPPGYSFPVPVTEEVRRVRTFWRDLLDEVDDG